MSGADLYGGCPGCGVNVDPADHDCPAAERAAIAAALAFDLDAFERSASPFVDAEAILVAEVRRLRALLRDAGLERALRP